MIRTYMVLALLVIAGIAGCTKPNNEKKAQVHHDRQMPSIYEPGIHVSGHVNVGVVKDF